MYNKKIQRTDKFTKTTIRSHKNISEYSKTKILCILRKDKTLQNILFVEDDDDKWFIDVVTYKAKSGVIVDIQTIIRPDVDHQILHLQHLGYEKLTNN